jgi:heptosyltransferase-2
VTEAAFRPEGPLVVRSPNWLGDAIMALPAVRNLKTLVMTDPLTVAAPEKLAPLWQACPFVDQVIVLPQPRNIRAVAAQLREGKFGTAILLPNSLRAALEVFLARIPHRIGFARGGRGLLLTRTVPVPPRDPVRLHQKFYYLDLATACGAPTDESFPSLRKSSSLPQALPWQVAICPGAEYGPAKRWPIENYVAVAKHLAEKQNAKIVIFGAAADEALAGELAALVPGAENRAGKTTLAEFMTALEESRLVICNDSGAMHLASALGVPTVAIFGSTEPELTGPMGSRTAVLRHHVPCSPCFLRECPIDFACMRSITPEMVIALADKLLL